MYGYHQRLNGTKLQKHCDKQMGRSESQAQRVTPSRSLFIHSMLLFNVSMSHCSARWLQALTYPNSSKWRQKRPKTQPPFDRGADGPARSSEAYLPVSHLLQRPTEALLKALVLDAAGLQPSLQFVHLQRQGLQGIVFGLEQHPTCIGTWILRDSGRCVDVRRFCSGGHGRWSGLCLKGRALWGQTQSGYKAVRHCKIGWGGQ